MTKSSKAWTEPTASICRLSFREETVDVEIEKLDMYLRGIPAWFREQHPVKTDAAWTEWLAPRREGLEARHREIMAEIVLMQRTPK